MTARCPNCRRQVAVRVDGCFVVHFVTLPVSARAVPSVGTGSVKRRCSGSGRPAPATAQKVP